MLSAANHRQLWSLWRLRGLLRRLWRCRPFLLGFWEILISCWFFTDAQQWELVSSPKLACCSSADLWFHSFPQLLGYCFIQALVDISRTEQKFPGQSPAINSRFALQCPSISWYDMIQLTGGPGLWCLHWNVAHVCWCLLCPALPVAMQLLCLYHTQGALCTWPKPNTKEAQVFRNSMEQRLYKLRLWEAWRGLFV